MLVSRGAFILEGFYAGEHLSGILQYNSAIFETCYQDMTLLRYDTGRYSDSEPGVTKPCQ